MIWLEGQNMTWSILRSGKMGCFLMTAQEVSDTLLIQFDFHLTSHQVGLFGCLVMTLWKELVVWVPEYPVWRSTELNLLAVWTPRHASGCLWLPSPEMLEIPWDSNLEHGNDRILWFATFRYPLHGSRFVSKWTCIDVLFHSFSLGSEASIPASFMFSSALHQEDLEWLKIPCDSAKLLARSRCTYCIIYIYLCFMFFINANSLLPILKIPLHWPPFATGSMSGSQSPQELQLFTRQLVSCSPNEKKNIERHKFMDWTDCYGSRDLKHEGLRFIYNI